MTENHGGDPLVALIAISIIVAVMVSAWLFIMLPGWLQDRRRARMRFYLAGCKCKRCERAAEVYAKRVVIPKE